MASAALADILKLPIQQRLKLVDDICKSVADEHPEPKAVPLTLAQQHELAARLDADTRDPDAGSSWADVEARLRARHRLTE